MDPFDQLLEKLSKQVPNMIEKGTKNRRILNDISSCCGKRQTAFGPSRLQRIGVQATCFRPLSLPFEANGARRLPGYSQMGARRPRRLISLIFVDFHTFSCILGGFRASWARRLERPAAGNFHRTATPIN